MVRTIEMNDGCKHVNSGSYVHKLRSLDITHPYVTWNFCYRNVGKLCVYARQSRSLSVRPVERRTSAGESCCAALTEGGRELDQMMFVPPLFLYHCQLGSRDDDGVMETPNSAIRVGSM